MSGLLIKGEGEREKEFCYGRRERGERLLGTKR